MPRRSSPASSASNQAALACAAREAAEKTTSPESVPVRREPGSRFSGLARAAGTLAAVRAGEGAVLASEAVLDAI
ncbi:hypothetical protein K270103H11_27060 [Gordonibacter urolithinfaciens]